MRARCWVVPTSRVHDSNLLLLFTRQLLFRVSHRGMKSVHLLPPEKESHLRLPGFNRALFFLSYLAMFAVPAGIEPAPPA